jgi:16S rRNA (adenine1518-N6/adenine1519-N6)-dimethyltransferase
VESALVELVRREAVRTVDEELFDRLLRAGFGQRRKMLRRSLAGLVGEATMAATGVEPTARPETLSLDEWYALTDAVGSS